MTTYKSLLKNFSCRVLPEKDIGFAHAVGRDPWVTQAGAENTYKDLATKSSALGLRDWFGINPGKDYDMMLIEAMYEVFNQAPDPEAIPSTEPAEIKKTL